MGFNKEKYAENYGDGGRIRGEKILRECPQCDKQFEVYVSQDHRKHCSLECKWKSGRTTIQHPCDFCGKMLSIEPARLKWSKERGRGRIFCNKECQRQGNRGEGSPLWIEDRGTLKDRRHTARNSVEYIEWRTAVFERDGYTCQKCGKIGGYLHAHHIKEWEYYPELRYEVSNGMTLCRRPCHKEIHDSRRSNRKVSDEQVVEIRAMRNEGATLDRVAKKFGISQGTVCNICLGKTRNLGYNTTPT